MSPRPPIPAAELDEILHATAPLWPEVRNQRLFLTGGTGFFGCWLVESFLHINRALSLDAQLTVLTRDPHAFLAKLPHLMSNAALVLIPGDVRDFDFPPGDFPFVIHAATEASARQMAEQPDEMHSTILAGTSRVLDFARQAHTHKLLLTSSGAIYGLQPPTLSHLPEDFAGTPNTIYAQGKLAAERLCLDAASASLHIKIARGFAFLGPHLPLDTHFAAGNFLRDALASRDIHIASDGSAVRSYLYASDLATWLWTMLFAGVPGRAYNLGSEDAVSIRQLAETTRSVLNPAISVEVAQTPDPARPVHRYVPATARARTELNLRQTVSLEDGLRRTAAWHRLE